MSARASLADRLKSALAGDRLARWLPLAAALWMLPTLGHGLQLDDVHLRAGLLGSAHFASLERPWWRLFSFFDPASNGWFVDRGLGPWWIDPHMRASFLRPVSALTHWVDFHAYPKVPALMHAQNVLWYALLVALAAALYRRLLGRGTWVAGFASFAYAFDYTHGQVVEWVANRNALVAGCFGLLSVLAHDEARKRSSFALSCASVVALALALGSGESALGACAMLFAHALFLDEARPRERVKALAPHALVGLAWALVYRAGHFGVQGSGLYTDPSRDPLGFLQGAVRNAPLLLCGEILGPPDLHLFLSPPASRAVLALCVAALALAGVSLAPLLTARDRVARFFLASLLLGVIPSLATFPAARLLLLPGFGALGLLALWLEAASREPSPWSRAPARRMARSYGYFLGFAHLCLSPFSMQVAASQMWIIDRTLARFSEGIGDDPALRSQRVVVVNAPDVVFLGYTTLMRELAGRPVPGALLQLAAGRRDIELSRPDAETLTVRVSSGFYRVGTELLVRRPGAPMPVGTHVALTAVAIEVTETAADGVPTEARVRFAVPLEDASLRWLRWQGRALVPFAPPRVGERVTIAGQLPSL